MPGQVGSKRSFRAAVAAIAVLVACGTDGRERADPAPEPTSQASAVRDVTVRGPVTDVPGRQVVTLGRPAEEPLVVIFRRPTPVAVGTVLEVTGRVRVLRVAELESELGIDLEPAVERFEGVSCLLASSPATA